MLCYLVTGCYVTDLPWSYAAAATAGHQQLLAQLQQQQQQQHLQQALTSDTLPQGIVTSLGPGSNPSSLLAGSVPSLAPSTCPGSITPKQEETGAGTDCRAARGSRVQTGGTAPATCSTRHRGSTSKDRSPRGTDTPGATPHGEGTSPQIDSPPMIVSKVKKEESVDHKPAIREKHVQSRGTSPIHDPGSAGQPGSAGHTGGSTCTTGTSTDTVDHCQTGVQAGPVPSNHTGVQAGGTPTKNTGVQASPPVTPATNTGVQASPPATHTGVQASPPVSTPATPPDVPCPCCGHTPTKPPTIDSGTQVTGTDITLPDQTWGNNPLRALCLADLTLKECNSPPVLTKITDYEGRLSETGLAPTPGRALQAPTPGRAVQAPTPGRAVLQTRPIPCPLQLHPAPQTCTDTQMLQAAAGLQMLSLLAADLTQLPCQQEDTPGHISPDINSNYNVPKSRFFMEEDLSPTKVVPVKARDMDLGGVFKLVTGK